jgi:hypothetical protein
MPSQMGINMFFALETCSGTGYSKGSWGTHGARELSEGSVVPGHWRRLCPQGAVRAVHTQQLLICIHAPQSNA